MPQRIQRRMVKGWRAPEGAVYVGRGSIWGNPFRVGGKVWARIGPGGSWAEAQIADNQQAANLYRSALEQARRGILPAGADRTLWDRLRGPENVRYLLGELQGRDLMCWCPLDRPCHADVLLELANGGTP